jgi:hypothetical protein
MTSPYQSALVRCWGARIVLERRHELVDAPRVLASRAALEVPTAAAGAEALAELRRCSGLQRAERLLADWLEARPGGR